MNRLLVLAGGVILAAWALLRDSSGGDALSDLQADLNDDGAVTEADLQLAKDRGILQDWNNDGTIDVNDVTAALHEGELSEYQANVLFELVNFRDGGGA